MRLLLLASAVSLIGGAAFAQTMLGQSSPGQGAGGTQAPAMLVPPPPPVVAAPPTAPVAPVAPSPAPPPGLVETPLPPPGSGNADNGNGANTDNGGTAQAQAVSPAAPNGLTPAPAPASNGAVAPGPSGNNPAPLPNNDVAPTPPNDWVPGKTAEIGVLSKADGSTSTLTIPVGGQATAGDLIVSVQACATRPQGQLPDAAIFLTLQSKDGSGSAPLYHGWMVRSAPGATDAGNAGEAFRVMNCS
ncbi:DUF2155 domain-containing protein [Acidocella facilis]|uniref:DUF2155 domain-containing protein n=1 Tax=Acidocella facilis TaxID=525 RepID=UPI00068C5C8B|nr:DUF2155 domain-containing protein [Acidocella facilis]